MISFLRLLGIVLGAGTTVVAVRGLLSVGRGSRVPSLFQGIIGVALVVAAVDPDVLQPLRDRLGLQDQTPGRLLALMLVAIALAYPLTFYAMGRGERAGRSVRELARALAVSEAGRPPFAVGPDDIIVCIPAYNEADNLASVLEQIPVALRATPVHTLVIDDGSEDATSEVAREGGAWVARHPVRLGGGGALMTAYRLAGREHPAIVVTMDADGQHDPAELDRLVDPIAQGRADFVIGSRRLGSADPAPRVRSLGITLFTFLINLLGRTQLSDVSNGYRAVRGDRLADLALREELFPNPELLLAASRAGLRVVEVPVTIRQRSSGTSKKGGNLRYGLGFFRVLLRSWLR